MRKLFVVIAVVMALVFPASVFAADTPPAGTVGGTMQVEIRYAEGETPDIPQEITRFGFVYHLVGVSDPILEGELPTVRTYTYNISGALTEEQLKDIEGLGALTLTPVNIVFEEEVDKIVVIENLKRNDVEEFDELAPFTVTSGTHPSGFETKMLRRTGVTFELYAPPNDKDKYGRPAGYKATAIYRGVQSYLGVGYYTAEAVFTTYEEEDDGTIVYVVIADYATEDVLPPIDDVEMIVPPVEPEGTGTGLSITDDERIALQGGNLLQNLMDGLVPLGGLGVTGVWSFLSLILSACAIGMAVVFLLGAVSKGKRVAALAKLGMHDEERLAMVKRRGSILRAITIMAGLVTLAVWLYLDDFAFGMVWINSSTVTVGILFGVALALCVLTNLRNKKTLGDDPDDGERGDGFAPGFTTA